MKNNKKCDNCDNVITGGEYRIGELHLCYRCYTALKRHAFNNKDVNWTDEDEKLYKTLQSPEEKREYSAIEIRKQINQAKQSLFNKFLENCKRMKGRKNGETVSHMAKVYLGSDNDKNSIKIRTWLNKARKKGIPIFVYNGLHYIPTKKEEGESIQRRYWKYKNWNNNSYVRAIKLLKIIPNFTELTITKIRKFLKNEESVEKVKVKVKEVEENES